MHQQSQQQQQSVNRADGLSSMATLVTAIDNLPPVPRRSCDNMCFSHSDQKSIDFSVSLDGVGRVPARKRYYDGREVIPLAETAISSLFKPATGAAATKHKSVYVKCSSCEELIDPYFVNCFNAGDQRFCFSCSINRMGSEDAGSNALWANGQMFQVDAILPWAIAPEKKESIKIPMKKDTTAARVAGGKRYFDGRQVKPLTEAAGSSPSDPATGESEGAQLRRIRVKCYKCEKWIRKSCFVSSEATEGLRICLSCFIKEFETAC